MAIEAPPQTAEQLHRAAAGNYLELVYATLEFLKQREIPISEYARFVGLRHAETWQPRKAAAREVAELMATNMQSVGAPLVEVTGDAREARLLVSDWPPAGYERYQVDLEDVDEFIQLIAQVAEREACSFGSSREDGRLVMTFSRRE